MRTSSGEYAPLILAKHVAALNRIMEQPPEVAKKLLNEAYGRSGNDVPMFLAQVIRLSKPRAMQKEIRSWRERDDGQG